MSRLVPLALALLCGCPQDDLVEQQLLEAIQSDLEDYPTWGGLPGWDAPTPTLDGTHGTHARIWANPSFLATIDEGGGAAMPEGATAFKEGYDDETGTEPLRLVGHTRHDGELFYAAFEVDTHEVITYGRPALCVDCHTHGQDEVMALEW